MTIDEAIKHAREVAKGNREKCTQYDFGCDKFSKCLECAEEHEQLAKWLEELKKYRAIGTVNEFKSLKEDWLNKFDRLIEYRKIGTLEECRAAVEKQKAKKPQKTESAGYRYTDTYRCPNCGGNFTGTGIAGYCYHCGQKLDWS